MGLGSCKQNPMANGFEELQWRHDTKKHKFELGLSGKHLQWWQTCDIAVLQ